MAYLPSKDVVVFPIAKERCTEATENRLLTEKNISNMIRQLFRNNNNGSNNNGFIIYYSEIKDTNDIITDFIIEFNLYGYYFKVNLTKSWLSKLVPDTNTSCEGIYASIKIDSKTFEIVNQDVKTDGKWKYQGLELSTEQPSETNDNESITKNLKILSRIEENGTYKWVQNINNSGFSSTFIRGIDGKYE